MLSNYKFDRYMNDKSRDKQSKLEKVYLLIAEGNENDSQVEKQCVVSEETLMARDLGNERSEILTPAYMEERALASATEIPGLSVRVLQQDEIRSLGLNMLNAVGQAAVVPPRLVILEYKGDPDSAERIALVGKGITFDTGGLNLKPTGFIEDMHMDMCGSAAVLGAVRAAARTGLKKNVVAALAMAENAIDAHSMKPHAIIQSYQVDLRDTHCSKRPLTLSVG